MSPANLPDVESWPRTGCKRPCELAILELGNGITHAMSGAVATKPCTKPSRGLPGPVSITDIRCFHPRK